MEAATTATAHGNHFSCSMTAVLIARVEAHGGPEAVRALLREAGSVRSVDYLLDTGNWLCYDEAVALWRAGARVTHHPQFARAVGEDAARRLNGSPVAALLRSLGSPQSVYEQIATSTGRFSTVSRLETVASGPGHAEVVAVAVDGFPRAADHCAWTCGLLTQPTVLFGLPPASVEHEVCAAFGAPECVYRVRWEQPETSDSAAEEIAALRHQLEAMHERLHNMFATAADLIAADGIDGVLARITDRAAQEVRAPRHMLAVRLKPDGEVHCQRRGPDAEQPEIDPERLLEQHPASLPDHWLAVPVRSERRDYGRLLAMYDEGQRYFPQERELLEVYARYAASALDSATALIEAQERYAQSSALLQLARALAVAGTSDEVARRLADAVPVVVECDCVEVYLWNELDGTMVRRATSDQDCPPESVWAPAPGDPLQRLMDDPRSEPLFVEDRILVPLASADALLGLLTVSVAEGRARLEPTPDVLDRLSGVAAQASTALMNGHLVDQITHQALHDPLTGLANRLQFTDDLRRAVERARPREETVVLLYVDLDGFKPVNDELGHDAGDALLIEVGRRLTACTRGDDTVARLGGDEFAVLIAAQSDANGTPILGERIAAALARPVALDGREVSIAASIGCAAFPQDAETADGLLRHADAEMFRTKRTHRGTAAA